MAHSKTLFRYKQAEEYPDNLRYWIYDQAGYIVGDALSSDDNARFIVTACNSHDELLAACKKAVELLALLRLDANIGDFLHDDERRFYHDTDDQLRAAIAKAEGGA